MAQAAQAHHAHPVALLAVPLAQGRVGGDARAQERRRTRGVETRGNAQGEALVHHHLGGVAAVGGRLPVHLGAVVGEGAALLAELLRVPLAGGALPARVHHAAHARQVAHLEASHGDPTAFTRPTISWPGTMGKSEPPHSSRTWWMSEWQTPQ